MPTKLSVNLNKVATLRNTRATVPIAGGRIKVLAGCAVLTFFLLFAVLLFAQRT